MLCDARASWDALATRKKCQVVTRSSIEKTRIQSSLQYEVLEKQPMVAKMLIMEQLALRISQSWAFPIAVVLQDS